MMDKQNASRKDLKVCRFAACTLIMMLLILMPSCGASDETADESQSEIIDVEEGSTFKDDGFFSYALVIKNNASDKNLSKVDVVLSAYDEDGEELKERNEGENIFRIGPIRPGEQAAVCINSLQRIWEGTPAKISYVLVGMGWSEADSPQLAVVNSEIVSTDDGDYNNITIKNNGDEDFDWPKLIEDASMSTKNMDIYIVYRDDEGKVVGGVMEYFEKYDTRINEDAEGFPVIPAGGEVTLSTYCYEDESVLGTPEYIITYIP